jgi:hypothetical protein
MSCALEQVWMMSKPIGKCLDVDILPQLMDLGHVLCFGTSLDDVQTHWYMFGFEYPSSIDGPWTCLVLWNKLG